MNCPNCGNQSCSVINEVTTEGSDFNAGNACCGYVLWGPIGLLCGACSDGKKNINTNYWVCNNCGNKFRL